MKNPTLRKITNLANETACYFDWEPYGLDCQFSLDYYFEIKDAIVICKWLEDNWNDLPKMTIKRFNGQYNKKVLILKNKTKKFNPNNYFGIIKSENEWGYSFIASYKETEDEQ